MKKEDWKILENYGIIPDNLSVGGYLDLEGTAITSLPDNLSVGGYLYLQGTAITYPVVYNCGRSDRQIQLKFSDRTKILIGCFEGTKEEAIKAISERYNGKEKEDYIAKVNECFAMNEINSTAQ